MNRVGTRRIPVLLASIALACSSCGSWSIPAPAGSERRIIRITGSDTMVNLLQAWAEEYRHAQPAVMVQVAGGGSGVGIAGLIGGTLDVAAASREMRPSERQHVLERFGLPPQELAVARDALAVYVHASNPLDTITLPQLAEIYGERGNIRRWSQLGIAHAGCSSGEIVRVGRQNNSGTFAYFRDVVLGRREYEMGSIDQSGSKDVVALISRTPCAIGYSGAAFAIHGVSALKVAARPELTAAAPNRDSVLRGIYPLARPLYLYTGGPPNQNVRDFLGWVLDRDGQRVVTDLGFMPPDRQSHTAPPAGGA
jgi:phosphate transport system substrate-binding protein